MEVLKISTTTTVDCGVWVDTTSVFYCQSSQCTFVTDDDFHYDGTSPCCQCHHDRSRLVLVVLDYNNNIAYIWTLADRMVFIDAPIHYLLVAERHRYSMLKEIFSF